MRKLRGENISDICKSRTSVSKIFSNRTKYFLFPKSHILNKVSPSALINIISEVRSGDSNEDYYISKAMSFERNQNNKIVKLYKYRYINCINNRYTPQALRYILDNVHLLTNDPYFVPIYNVKFDINKKCHHNSKSKCELTNCNVVCKACKPIIERLNKAYEILYSKICFEIRVI